MWWERRVCPSWQLRCEWGIRRGGRYPSRQLQCKWWVRRAWRCPSRQLRRERWIRQVRRGRWEWQRVKLRKVRPKRAGWRCHTLGEGRRWITSVRRLRVRRQAGACNHRSIVGSSRQTRARPARLRLTGGIGRYRRRRHIRRDARMILRRGKRGGVSQEVSLWLF